MTAVCILRSMSSPHYRVSTCYPLILLILQVCFQMVQSMVTLSFLEGASGYHATSVTLICIGGSGGVAFFIKGEHEGTTRNISLQSRNEVGIELTIDVTVMNEGIYFCTVGDERSTNEVPIVGENLNNNPKSACATVDDCRGGNQNQNMAGQFV